MDEVARARAILGIPPDVSLRQLKRRYRELVRRWHPDRFASDSRDHAEATARMREINDAFRAVAGRMGPSRAPASSPDSERESRLSQEQTEKIIARLGAQGPVDWLLEWVNPIGWLKSVVSSDRMAFELSIAIGLLLGAIPELSGIIKRPALTPWLMGGSALCGYLVLRQLLRGK